MAEPLIELRRYSDGSRRWMLTGTRVKPALFWHNRHDYSVEQLYGMFPWCSIEAIIASIEWCQRRSDAARRGWASRKASRSDDR